MQSESSVVCLICLKRFDHFSSSGGNDDTNNEPRCVISGGSVVEESATHHGVQEEPFMGYDIYTRFLQFSCRYLRLSSTAEVFLMAATKYKSDTGKCLHAFCDNCNSLVSNLCDLYAEFQTIKLRLMCKLGEMEEVMVNGRKRLSKMLFRGLLKVLMEQLHVKSKTRVEVFRIAFQNKCVSKLKNSVPKPLVPRGLFPEEWKYGYPACKLTLMRLIIIFQLASLHVKPDKKNAMIKNKDATTLPNVSRRGRGRSKSVLPSNHENENSLMAKTNEHTETDQTKEVETESIKTEHNAAEAGNEEIVSVNDDDGFPDALSNGNDSDWSRGGTASRMGSAGSSDDDFKLNVPIDEASSPKKRWNLRKRKRKSVVAFVNSDSENEVDRKSDKEKGNADKTAKPPTVNEPPKNLRGWPRVGDCEPSVPCTKCSKMFLDKRSLATHLVYVHNIHIQYSCVHCGQKFIRWKDLRNHRRKMHPIKRTYYRKKTEAAGKDGEASKNKRGPGRPKKGMEKKDYSKCSKCDVVCSTISDLRAHNREVHLQDDRWSRKPKERKCPKCPEVFMSLKEFVVHKREAHCWASEKGKRWTTRAIPSKCSICSDQFPNLHSLVQHRRKKHRQGDSGRPAKGETKCTRCDRVFPTGKEMLEHRRKEHVAKFGLKLSSGEVKCNKCALVFASAELLKAHHKLEHKIKVVHSKHECSVCFRTVVSEGRFKRHMERHERDTARNMEMWYCEVCSKHFYKEESLSNHMSQGHNNLYTCSVCNEHLESGKLLRDHLVTHEKTEKFFHCMTCFRGFSTQQYYDIHRKIAHMDKRRFHCDHDFCNEVLDNIESLNEHLKIHLAEAEEKGDPERTTIQKCHVCDKPFIQKYNFTIHVITHTPHNEGRPGYDCPTCGQTVRYMETLLSHYNRYHGLNIIPCECFLCGKGFHSSITYKEHLRECLESQTDEQSLCTVCGIKFPDRKTLAVHKKENHYNNKQKSRGKKRVELVPCPEPGCHEMKLPYKLNFHLVRDHGKGDMYPCDKCGRLFPDMIHVRKHARIHEPGRHKCNICEKVYKRPQELRKHRLAAHTENRAKAYCCHLCGSSYYTKQGLKYHTWSLHTSSDELRHICPYCHKGYGRKTLLTLHMKNCSEHGKQVTSENNAVAKPKEKRKLKFKRNESKLELEEMSDRSTTDEENDDKDVQVTNQKSSDLSHKAPSLFPHQLPQQTPSTTDLSSYQQWLHTTAATCNNNDFMPFLFPQRPTTYDQLSDPPAQSQSSDQQLHDL